MWPGSRVFSTLQLSHVVAKFLAIVIVNQGKVEEATFVFDFNIYRCAWCNSINKENGVSVFQ